MITKQAITVALLLAAAPAYCGGLGDLGFLNDIGLGTVRHAIRTAEKTGVVLGGRPPAYLNTPAINRGYGEIRNFRTTDIPTTVRNIQEIETYIFDPNYINPYYLGNPNYYREDD